MKVLICGAGRIARELLKRFGETWQVTVVERSEEAKERIGNLHPDLVRVVWGDASSPVVLDKAEIAAHDYILAMTGNDEVNLAVCRFAREHGISHVLSLAMDPEYAPRMQEAGAKVIQVNTMMAKTIYHYLEDPRVSVNEVAMGRGEVIEFDVTPKMWLAGQRAVSLSEGKWRLAAIFRGEEMIFPGLQTTIREGDRVVIVGQPDSFKPVCNLIECGRPHFPLAYGRGLVLVIPPGHEESRQRLLVESVFLARNTHIRNITVICPEDDLVLQNNQSKLAESVDIRIEPTDDVWDELYEFFADGSVGLVVAPPMDPSFLESLTKPTLITLAHSLPCPLFVARNTAPFETILVPYNGSPKAELAMETALDLANQIGARVTAVVVREPDFIHGAQDDDWVEASLEQIRALAHIHKLKVTEEVRHGNPVKEVTRMAKDYDLMVVGSTTRDKGLFSPHVGELLVRRSTSSVLIVTS